MHNRLIELIHDSDLSLDSVRLADHLLANGVVVPPVAIGGTVYSALGGYYESEEPFVCRETVTGIAYEKSGDWSVTFGDGEWYTLGGDFVKLTEKEAEKALEDRRARA